MSDPEPTQKKSKFNFPKPNMSSISNIFKKSDENTQTNAIKTEESAKNTTEESEKPIPEDSAKSATEEMSENPDLAESAKSATGEESDTSDLPLDDSIKSETGDPVAAPTALSLSVEEEEKKKKEEAEEKEEEEEDKEYEIEKDIEPYKLVSFRKIVNKGKKVLKDRIVNNSLEDVLYKVFCSQINHEVYAKPILKLYGETLIKMFDSEIFNCIGENNKRNNTICNNLDKMHARFSKSFQNIMIQFEKDDAKNKKLFQSELKYKGGILVITAKQMVNDIVTTKLPDLYMDLLDKLLTEAIIEAFTKFFHKKEYVSEFIKQLTVYFDFNNQSPPIGSLKIQKVNSVVNGFLDTHIKSKNKLSNFTNEVKDVLKILKTKTEKDKKIEEQTTENKVEKNVAIEGGENIDENTSKFYEMINDLMLHPAKDTFIVVVNKLLDCDHIQKYVINGFEKLLDQNIYKNIDHLEKTISYAFSELMMQIYDKGIYPDNIKSDISYKYKIIRNFVSNYPMNKLMKLLEKVCKDNYNLKKKLREEIIKSDKVVNKIMNYWDSDLTVFQTFLKQKKSNSIENETIGSLTEDELIKNIDKIEKQDKKLKLDFFQKFLKFIEPFVMKKGNINSGGNIKKINMKGGADSNITRKRKPCKKGTRWVEKAQRCLTEEEKQQFLVESRNNLQNLAHNSVVEPSPPVILLEYPQKKCPPGYIQHPRKSRRCVRHENIQKSNNLTKKDRSLPQSEEEEEEEETKSIENSKVPEIKTEEEVKNDVDEDISEEQHPIELEEVIQTEKKVKNVVLEKEEEIDVDIEKKEYDDYLKNPDTNSFLYPNLLDPDFNVKIASKKEFSDFRFDGEINDVKTQSQIECKAPFELLPNQQFVKNFLSIQTPYNSLLLYAGLGTGKTCAAIGVTEEMRLYMKQVGIQKKILIVASPNVQDNFRLQLFDENRLHEIGKQGSGVWNLDTCVGFDLLKEIQTANMTREYVVRKINSIINEYYDFIGYESLANYIEDMAGLQRSSEEDVVIEVDEKRIRRVFDDRLIVIDEVHNIIGKEENDSRNKHTSNMMMKLVKYCENLRLLFLSATPMYNSYKEIIWLANIMNINDHRSTIKVEQVFKSDGDFVEEKKDDAGIIIQESGKDLLKRKLIGYVSYVRGENPYTFPYRIYPSIFAENQHQLQKQTYPAMQLNGIPIKDPLQYLQIFITNMGDYQKKGYDLIINYAKDYVSHFDKKESFGYIDLQGPISALNMIYPNTDFDEYIENVIPPTSTGFFGITSIFGGDEKESVETGEKESVETGEKESVETGEKESVETGETGSVETGENKSVEEKPEKKVYSKEQIKQLIQNLHGKNGLHNIISFSKPNDNIPLFHDFEYKPEIIEKYGRIFHLDNIGKYSAKIGKICNILAQSSGIVIIYSKYIEGGLIPVALALEEMGFQRYGEASYNRSLFKEKPVDFVLNPLTMKPNGPTETYSAKYMMITGQKYYSPNNSADMKLVTDISNKHGEQVRVVLISEAGSEGLDFKNIRQVHILDPWYNINRIDQVIGRAVRNKSHCSLPIQDRNVEIYMHGTYIDNQYETADIYMYRLAEKKALQIGKVTRLLKETAVDCLLNIDQTNFTETKMAQKLNLTLSTNQKKIDFSIGDKPFSNMCDYMETCEFSCNGNTTSVNIKDIELSPSYDTYFLQNNHPRISKRIRQLFREKTFYTLDSLLKEINIIKPFPIEQIYYSISTFLKNRDEWLVDKKGRKGYLIQRKETYAFQPIEISNEKSSIFERSTPLDYKRKSITIETPKDPILTKKPTIMKSLNPDPDPIVVVPKKVDSVILSDYQSLFQVLQKDIDIVLNTDSYIKPLKQNMSWYRYAKLSLRVCVDKHKIDRKFIIRYIIQHHMDCLNIDKKLIFLNGLLYNFESFLFDTEEKEEEPVETILKKYFLERINQDDINKKYVLLNSKNNNIIYSLTKQSQLWKEEPTFPDNSPWLQTFNLRKELLQKVNSDTNKTESNVGFIGIFKESYGFKIKNLLNTRPKPGALCDQSDKQKLISKVNDLLQKMGKSEEEIYSKDPTYNMNAIERPNLCIIYELLMRFYTEKEKNIWFLSPEQAIASDLDHFVVIAQTLFGFTSYILQES